MKNLLRAASLAMVLAGVGVAVGASTPAFAVGTLGTTVSVSAKSPTAISGHEIIFHAVVTPVTPGIAKPTGTVTWSLTGTGGVMVPCASATPLGANGKSACTIAKASLLAAGSPYTVSATYSGDSNYAGNTGSLVETVTPARTHLRFVFSGVPSPGAPMTIEAYVTAGSGTSAISGNVTFAVASGLSAKGVKSYCEGPLLPASANNAQPVVGGFATCTLPAGWFEVAPVTGSDAHPRTRWAISASYDGNGSFFSSSSTRSGWVRG